MKPNKPLALQLAKRQLVELVFDAVNLEGINFTISEVQTLVDGITVGGHKISDTIITLNQKNTWLEIFEQIKYGHFSLSMENIHYLHSIAAKEEAMEWGVLDQLRF